MCFAEIFLGFPVVVAVHTLEEYMRYEEFVRASPVRLGKRFSTRRVFGGAGIVLTLGVGLLGCWDFFAGGGGSAEIARVAVFALLLNGVGHCVLSAWRRVWVPGTFSAIGLVLPYCVAAILRMRMEFGDSYWGLLGDAGLGVVAGPVAIFACVWIAYEALRLWGRIQRRT